MRAFYKIPKKIFNSIIPMGVLLIGVSSCTVSQGTVGVNDGIYYDPSTDSQVRESYRYDSYEEYENETYQEPVRIGGKYFDDYGYAPSNVYTQTSTYQPTIGTGRQAADYIEWGDEGETKIDVINNYYGYGLYSPLYSPLAYSYYDPFGPYYGNYFSMWGGYNYGFSFGWNSFFGNPYYRGFYGMGYYPYYYGYPYYRGYRGYYGYYSPYYGYNPYYGYGGGYYYPRQYRRVERGRANNNGVNIGNTRATIEDRSIRRRAVVNSENVRNGSTYNSSNRNSSNNSGDIMIRRRSSVNTRSSESVTTPRQNQYNRRNSYNNSNNNRSYNRSSGRANNNSSRINSNSSSNFGRRPSGMSSGSMQRMSAPSRSSGATIMRRSSR